MMILFFCPLLLVIEAATAVAQATCSQAIVMPLPLSHTLVRIFAFARQQ